MHFRLDQHDIHYFGWKKVYKHVESEKEGRMWYLKNLRICHLFPCPEGYQAFWGQQDLHLERVDSHGVFKREPGDCDGDGGHGKGQYRADQTSLIQETNKIYHKYKYDCYQGSINSYNKFLVSSSSSKGIQGSPVLSSAE